MREQKNNTSFYKTVNVQPHVVDAGPLTINLDSACDFLDALDPAGQFTFQTFHDSRHSGLARIIHANSIIDIASQLADLNERGAGIFVTVNRTDGRGRKSENIIGLRALFIDADGIPRPQQWHLLPDFIVWRDDHHWHAYWLINPSTPLAEFNPSQQRLIKFYGTDPAVHDLSRVMRLPGFLHRKQQPTPVYFEDLRNANSK